MTIREVLSRASALLRSSGIQTPRLDAEVILASVLGKDRSFLAIEGNSVVRDDSLQVFEGFLARRAAHEPVAYITGEREFWSLPFRVTPDTLVPRPETETLVEKVLESARSEGWKRPWIIDAGTGSGNIAVSLASELSGARILAIDRSHAALLVARENARRNRVDERIFFLRADWLQAAGRPSPNPEGFPGFACVVSNPPYVALNEQEIVAIETLGFEPRQALFGGPDGMDAIRAIMCQAPRVLAPGGLLIMEIGWTQGEKVSRQAARTGLYEDVRIMQDLSGNERVFLARVREGQG